MKSAGMARRIRRDGEPRTLVLCNGSPKQIYTFHPHTNMCYCTEIYTSCLARSPNLTLHGHRAVISSTVSTGRYCWRRNRPEITDFTVANMPIPILLEVCAISRCVSPLRVARPRSAKSRTIYGIVSQAAKLTFQRERINLLGRRRYASFRRVMRNRIIERGKKREKKREDDKEREEKEKLVTVF